jgi:hypothetical protein
MAIGDILKDIGAGAARGAKAVGAVLEPIAERTAQVESGEAPQIDEQQRQQKQKLANEGIEAQAQELERGLETGRKYGTLTPQQQQQYVDAISKLYSHPSQMGTLMTKLQKAIHPDGATYQTNPLPNPEPLGGTAAADEANAERLAAARYHARPQSPNAQYYDAYAQKLGLADSSQMTPEQWEAAIGAQKTAGRTPVEHHWAPLKFNGNLYFHDPATNEMKFVGPENDVTVHRGVQNVTQANGDILQIPVTTYTSKQSGKPLIDPETQQPYQTLEPDNHPDNPSTGESKPKTAQAGPPKPGNILPKKPVAGAASVKPSAGGIPGAKMVGSRGSPLLKSDQAQYTKVANDANGANEALVAATGALKAPSPTSDQELIYSWVRSNVQGAGRMTQAEFKLAAVTGSLGLKAQNWWSLASTGKLTDEMRNMMFADVKRGTAAKQAEAARLRQQVQQDMNPGATPASVLPKTDSAVDNFLKSLK